MVLVLILLALTFVSSWQQEITEKSLNQILDQLIEETVLATYSNENQNNSKIIYIKQDNLTRLDTVHSSEFENLEDLVHKIENHVGSEAGNEVTFQIERTGHYDANDGDQNQDMDVINNEIPKSVRTLQEGPSSKIVVLASAPESNFIHKYPEIIIDKISYDVAEDSVEPREETAMRQSFIKHLTNEQKREVAAKALDSLIKIITKGSQMGRKDDVSKEKDADLNNVQRSTHIHNAYHNHVINNVPLPYSGILAREKMTLDKLTEGFRDLQSIINSPRHAYLNSNLQLSRWGGDAGQSPLMSISRVHNRNRVHFIPESLNILPRIVFGPLFRRKYTG